MDFTLPIFHDFGRPLCLHEFPPAPSLGPLAATPFLSCASHPWLFVVTLIAYAAENYVFASVPALVGGNAARLSLILGLKLPSAAYERLALTPLDVAV